MKASRRPLAPGTKHFQRPAEQPKPYRVIAVGVYDDQARSLNGAAAELQEAGYLALAAMIQRGFKDTDKRFDAMDTRFDCNVASSASKNR